MVSISNYPGRDEPESHKAQWRISLVSSCVFLSCSFMLVDCIPGSWLRSCSVENCAGNHWVNGRSPRTPVHMRFIPTICMICPIRFRSASTVLSPYLFSTFCRPRCSSFLPPTNLCSVQHVARDISAMPVKFRIYVRSTERGLLQTLFPPLGCGKQLNPLVFKQT